MTPIPTPVPQRSDPANFPARADAVMTALPTFVTEANALQIDVSNKQSLSAASQIAAATSETNAAASAAASAASSTATAWVTGSTYSAGDVRFSLIDYRSYRRKTNGSGSTDPSADQVNWQVISAGPYPLIHVREEQPSGTDGGNCINGTQTRVSNTVVFNNVFGASLASNNITLPAGTYDVEISAPAVNVRHKASLYNNTDSAVSLIGTSELGSASAATRSTVTGRITITSVKSFKINHFTNSVQTNGLGFSAISGLNEIYTEAKFWKVA